MDINPTVARLESLDLHGVGDHQTNRRKPGNNKTDTKERHQQEEPINLEQLTKLESDKTPVSLYTPHGNLMRRTSNTFRDDPNIEMIVANPNRRVWSLGTRYIVKEWICPHNDGDNEANAMRLLKERGIDIPSPEIVLSWKDGDWALMISERLPGELLMDLWDGLLEADKHRIAKQTAGIVSKLRSIKSDTCCAFDGQSIKDVNMLLATEVREELGPLHSDNEVWDRMFKPRLDRAGVDEDSQRFLRKAMPPSGPYTFTHGDLAFSNILIKDGNVSGILDFELSAYLPAWWEYVAAQFGFCREDREWRGVLRQYLEPHEQAFDWYLYWAELCKTPQPEDLDIWREILAKYE